MNDEFPRRCTYCWKDWEPDQLRALPENLKCEPRNKYCPKCYPEVLAEVRNLPWNRMR